jgi:hypothetical protein
MEACMEELKQENLIVFFTHFDEHSKKSFNPAAWKKLLWGSLGKEGENFKNKRHKN